MEKVVKRRRGELKGSQVYGFKTPKPDGRSAAARRQVKIDERGKGKTNFGAGGIETFRFYYF